MVDKSAAARQQQLEERTAERDLVDQVRQGDLAAFERYCAEQFVEDSDRQLDLVMALRSGQRSVLPLLFDQLAEGGRLVIPVGERNLQRLVVVTRHGGTFEEQERDGVNFVPLVGGTA